MSELESGKSAEQLKKEAFAKKVEETKFEDLNLDKKRGEDETYEDYKERMKLIDKVTRKHLRGKVVYDPYNEDRTVEEYLSRRGKPYVKLTDKKEENTDDNNQGVGA